MAVVPGGRPVVDEAIVLRRRRWWQGKPDNELRVIEGPTRHLATLAAFALAVGYFVMILSYWAPASPSTNQHAYLTGGRMLLQGEGYGVKPPEPYGFVGPMYVVGDAEEIADARLYPKYPIGTSIASAIGRHFGGPVGAQLYSPVAASLAVLGMFFLARPFAGSFGGLLAMILLGTTQIFMLLAVNPLSHAVDVAIVTWGFVGIMTWLLGGGTWRGVLGGLLLGCAFAVRYTEGLLVLSLAVACAGSFGRVGWRAVLPLMAWGLPVVGQFVFNIVTLGTPTGYDPSNESAGGFTLAWLTQNWERTLRLLDDEGLILILAPGIVGLILLASRRLTIGLVGVLWLVPQLLLYMSYYFVPEDTLNYVRFFVSLFPAVILGAMFLLHRGVLANPFFGRPWVGAVAAAAVVTLAGILGTTRAAYGNEKSLLMGFTLERAHAVNANLAALGEAVRQNVPDGSVVFAGGHQSTGGLVQHVDTLGDYELYASNAFSRDAFRLERRLRLSEEVQDDAPNVIDPRRLDLIALTYDDKTSAHFRAEAERVVGAARAEGRRTFAVLPARRLEGWLRRTLRDHEAKVVTRWTDIPQVVARDEVDEDEEDDPQNAGRRQSWGAPRQGPSRALRQALRQQWVVAEIVPESTEEPATQPATPDDGE